MSIMFTQICSNEEMLPKYTYFKVIFYRDVTKLDEVGS